jgi:hypothetical protein
MHKNISMKRIKPGAGFTIFLIFFGIAILEAFDNRNWLLITFWLVIGALFLLFDIKGKKAN